jgi:hypothetical protein
MTARTIDAATADKILDFILDTLDPAGEGFVDLSAKLPPGRMLIDVAVDDSDADNVPEDDLDDFEQELVDFIRKRRPFNVIVNRDGSSTLFVPRESHIVIDGPGNRRRLVPLAPRSSSASSEVTE